MQTKQTGTLDSRAVRDCVRKESMEDSTASSKEIKTSRAKTSIQGEQRLPERSVYVQKA